MKKTVDDKSPSYQTVLVDTLTDYKKTENDLFNRVFRIPEVQQFAKYLERKTKGKRKLLMMLAGKPDKSNKYYWVKVGEDNGSMFVTHYNFYVFTDKREIKYLDVVKDSAISLTDWRRGNGR